ncbi:MAG TPA: type II secretion system ATPase GspE [Rhabdochlamydiaceae bacterium]|nr:type II secretion system ATPase GspE [Rhabdochlamydiaceae bacterium]
MSTELEDIHTLGKRYGIDVLSDLSDFPLIKEKKQLLPYDFAKKKWVIPLEEKEMELLVAMADPLDLETIEEVRCLTGKPIKEVFALKETIDDAIERCYRQKDNAASQLLASLREGTKSSEEKEETEGYDLLNQHQANSPVIRILNAILLEAIQQGASDIHFEPLENGLCVRYRIDGVLQMRHAPPREYQIQILTRIKVMARMDIAEQRLPQDGRIKLNIGGRQIDFRVSTIPVVYGERIVLRILDKSNVLLGLNKLGMVPYFLEQLKKLIELSEGIVLVTGPTGSGKTTTLYSALSEIDSTHSNIMTVEDPVEYKLQGMAQIGVNPKINLTFSTGLRHILRQDPDVIMIGEIRDRETAEIAIQASLTGHLVLSTLHTNDAPSALTRLVDMGIEPYLLSSSVVGVLAQRLVRTICKNCRVSYTPSDPELHDLGLCRDQLPEGVVFKGEGCKECFNTGFKGRCGIYELMVMNGPIKRQLIQSVDSNGLQKVALSHGMRTLRQDGGRLVKEGVTSVTEVLRVTRSCED